MFTRYAIYFTPDGALAEAGAAWLGWDVATGQPAVHPDVAGLDPAQLTDTPRKYGFHGTLKPPLVLQKGKTSDQMQDHLHRFCKTKVAVSLEGLEVAQMGRFFALTPVGDVSALRALAAEIVMAFDPFRATPSSEELKRRRAAGLSPAQEQYLTEWGYPYVLDQFRFHMTLTGRVKNTGDIAGPIKEHFEPVLPAPFVIDHLTFAGQRKDGMFEQIARVPLTG